MATPFLGSSDLLVRQLCAEGGRSTGRASHASSQEYQEEISQYYLVVKDIISNCLFSLPVMRAEENGEKPTDGILMLNVWWEAEIYESTTI